MISSVQTVPSSLTNISRANAQGVRGGAQQAASGVAPEADRSVDQVSNVEDAAVDLAGRQAASTPADGVELTLSSTFGLAGTDASGEQADPVRAEMELLAQKTALRANISVFRTQDQMLGSLLNVVG